MKRWMNMWSIACALSVVLTVGAVTPASAHGNNAPVTFCSNAQAQATAYGDGSSSQAHITFANNRQTNPTGTTSTASYSYEDGTGASEATAQNGPDHHGTPDNRRSQCARPFIPPGAGNPAYQPEHIGCIPSSDATTNEVLVGTVMISSGTTWFVGSRATGGPPADFAVEWPTYWVPTMAGSSPPGSFTTTGVQASITFAGSSCLAELSVA